MYVCVCCSLTVYGLDFFQFPLTRRRYVTHDVFRILTGNSTLDSVFFLVGLLLVVTSPLCPSKGFLFVRAFTEGYDVRTLGWRMLRVLSRTLLLNRSVFTTITVPTPWSTIFLLFFHWHWLRIVCTLLRTLYSRHPLPYHIRPVLVGPGAFGLVPQTKVRSIVPFGELLKLLLLLRKTTCKVFLALCLDRRHDGRKKSGKGTEEQEG